MTNVHSADRAGLRARRRRWVSCLATALALALGVAATPAGATIAYDEAIGGDLSNNGLAPNALAFALGDNDVFGSTGRGTDGVVDRDYFTFTVASGLTLAGIEVLPGMTTVAAGGGLAFIGLEAGDQLTVLPTTMTATGLLGWKHFSPGDIGTDILDDMAIPAAGSSGFSRPLPSGTYSIWIQETATGTADYGFRFRLGAVPEPETWALMIVGFGLMGWTLRRRGRPAPASLGQELPA